LVIETGDPLPMGFMFLLYDQNYICIFSKIMQIIMKAFSDFLIDWQKKQLDKCRIMAKNNNKIVKIYVDIKF